MSHPYAPRDIEMKRSIYAALIHFSVVSVCSQSAIAMSAVTCPELSDDQLVRIAIEQTIASPVTSYVNLPSQEYASWREGVISYRSVDEFLSINPNCCVISDQGTENYEMSTIDRIWHDFQAFVIVQYRVKIDIGNGIEFLETGPVQTAISACGHAIDLH
jgi:hypothetical protein